MSINSFASLLTKDIKTAPWYISGNILPKGGTLLFGGHSKTYKSFIALNMVRSLITGTNLFDCPFIECTKARVLLVEQEIGERGLQKRGSFIFYKVDPKAIEDNFFYLTKESILLNRPEGVGKLEKAIKEIKPNVLILDPIGKLHTYDENDATQIGALFTTFERFKKINPEQEMSIVLTHHFKKPPTGDYAKGYDGNDPHNFRGSVRWFSDPDTIGTVKLLNTPNDTVWKSFNLRLRFILRQEESPDDMVLSFNKEPIEAGIEEGDNLIRYEYSIGTNGDRKQKEKKKEKKPKGEQLTFKV